MYKAVLAHLDRRIVEKVAKSSLFGGCAWPVVPLRCLMATDTHPTTASQRTSRLRVLVAFEDIRSVYADAIAWAIRELRSGLHVRSAILEELEQELGSFAPHVVVCSQPSGTHPTGSGAWVHIPTDDAKGDDARLAQICLDGEHWRTDGPPLAELLEVLDETHNRLREGDLSEAC
jgi:hypothetical protein